MNKYICQKCKREIPEGDIFYIKVKFTNLYIICPGCKDNWDDYLAKCAQEFVKHPFYME